MGAAGTGNNRGFTRGAVQDRAAGWGHPALRSVARSAVGRGDVGIAPYGGETEIHLLSGGRGRTPPLRRATRGAGKESPSHGFAVTAPFRQGGRGDGGTDCHSQCAHWLRNDTLQVVR